MTKKKILLTLQIGGENGGPYLSHSRIMNSSLKEKYDMKPLMVPRSRVLLNPRGMRAFVNTIKQQAPDLVVVTGLQLEGFLLVKACRKAGVKCLLAVHGSSTEVMEISRAVKFLFAKMEIATVKKADAVFAVSDYVSGWKCLRHAKKHYGTVYNIPSFGNDTGNDLKSEFGFEQDDIVIVSTGRINCEKGYDILWQAIQKLGRKEHVKYLIAGNGTYREEWLSEIREKGFEDQVVLAGYRSDIDAVLNTADIFIICTKHETLCNSILEAGMHSLAVIATNVGGIPEIITNGESGMLIENGNVDEFANAMLLLINNAELRKKYGENARKKIMSKFDETKITERLDGIFTDLIEK